MPKSMIPKIKCCESLTDCLENGNHQDDIKYTDANGTIRRFYHCLRCGRALRDVSVPVGDTLITVSGINPNI